MSGLFKCRECGAFTNKGTKDVFIREVPATPNSKIQDQINFYVDNIASGDFIEEECDILKSVIMDLRILMNE